MTNVTIEKESLRQNLIDAGCDQATIACCLNMADQCEDAKMLPLLKHQRSCLLDEIHERQDQLNCLDYLMFQLGKQLNCR